MDEVDPQHLGLPVAEKKDCMVKIQNLTCYWDMVRLAERFLKMSGQSSVFLKQLIKFVLQMLEAPTLQNVSLTVKSEQLVAVIGPVGAGKVCSHMHSLC